MNTQKSLTELGHIEQLEKKILIGLDSSNQAIVLEINTIGYNQPNPHFSICGETFDMNEVFTEEQGQQKAEDLLENDSEYEYFWREAVQAERTIKGLEEWKEEVLDIDGWEHVLGGDLENIDGDLYCQMGSCGQIDIGDTLNDFDQLLISESDLEKINHVWDNFHLFDVQEMNDKRKKLTQRKIDMINEVVEIFKKYPKYEAEQLKQFVNGA